MNTRERFPLEPAVSAHIVMDHIKRPAPQIHQQEILPLENIKIRDKSEAGLTEYPRDLDDFKIRKTGSERYQTHGGAVTINTNFKVYGDKTVKSAFVEMESLFNDGTDSIVTFNKQLDRNKMLNDVQTSTGDKIQTAIRTMGIAIDQEFFEAAFFGDHSVKENSSGVNSTVSADEDGVTDYLIQTDLSVRDTATANEFLYELQSQIVNPMLEAGVDNIDNIQFCIPMDVHTYMVSYFKSGFERNVDPNQGSTRIRPTQTLNAQGIPLAGFTTAALGTYDDTGGGGTAGDRGYAFYRRALILTYDDYNRIADTVTVSGSLYGEALAYKDGIVQYLNSLMTTYDRKEREYLSDLINTKGYWPGSKLLPGNIFNINLQDMGSQNQNNIAFFLRTFMSVVRIAPTKCIRLLFENAKLPTAVNQNNLARNNRLRAERQAEARNYAAEHAALQKKYNKRASTHGGSGGRSTLIQTPTGPSTPQTIGTPEILPSHTPFQTPLSTSPIGNTPNQALVAIASPLPTQGRTSSQPGTPPLSQTDETTSNSPTSNQTLQEATTSRTTPIPTIGHTLPPITTSRGTLNTPQAPTNPTPSQGNSIAADAFKKASKGKKGE